MRLPTYLSYSSLSLFESDPPEFYIKYLADNRPARQPQTGPMCVGSAFDAYVKSALHEALYGKGADPVYELQTLFEDQVEPQNRDFAWAAGEHVFESYKTSGAYGELLELLKKSVEAPRFECKLTGDIDGAPFLGKPDCRFVLDLGSGRISIVLDWKVKGFCGKHAASPTKGYALCRDGFHGKRSRSHGKSHDMYMAFDFRGMEINRDYMENNARDYADQCSIYGWLLGEPIGSEESIVWIDEIVSKPTGNALEGEYPTLRVSNFRSRVKPEYQRQLVERITNCWQAVTSGHIFQEMTKEENDEYIEMLDQMATGLASDGSPEEDWYSEATRPQNYFRKR
jgi:hypothetical protein